MVINSPKTPQNGPCRCRGRWGPKYSIHYALSLFSVFCLLLDWCVIRTWYMRELLFGCNTSSWSTTPPPCEAHVSPWSRGCIRVRRKRVYLATLSPSTISSIGTKTDDEIAERDADMMHFMQLWNNALLECAEGVWNKALSCDRIYDHHVIK